MWDPLYTQVIAWVGLAVLVLLCLPFARVQKLVLELSALALRLALLALLGAAAYLWFRPGDLPAEVTDVLNNAPRLKALLPEAGAQHFGICAAAPLVIVLLPLLATLDVSRKLAGWRLRRLRALAAESPVAAPPPAPATVARRVDRRAAAEALAGAGSRKAFRTPNPLV
ncbi:MAG TPA: hypothetical protein VFW33_01935 [Gemmataceae bacterium]|nr:hypothetical protein [Gemmataceae bacterium]